MTNDLETFERIEMLRRHGGRVKYHHQELGLNSRLDELQAAVLRVKLRYLGQWNERRRQLAYRYNVLLADEDLVNCPQEPMQHGIGCILDTDVQKPISLAVYNQYTITIDQRDAVQARLKSRQINTAIYYPIPLHQQQVHANSQQAEFTFTCAERVARQCLSLPMHPLLTELEMQQVVCALYDVVAELSEIRACA